MDLDKLGKEALVGELSKRGEDTRGNKAVLRERLQEILKEETFQTEKPQRREETETQVDPDATSLRASSVRTTSSVALARLLEKVKLASLSAKKQPS